MFELVLVLHNSNIKMKSLCFCFTLLIPFVITDSNSSSNIPIVINTWPFMKATEAAWNALVSGKSAEDSLVIGCSTCEVLQCDGSVGYGSNPDEQGETTLDAMIMNGQTFEVGAVGDLRRVKNAIGVAHAVMKYSDHTLLVGESATRFAIEMGFKEESLATNKSRKMYSDWKKKQCQPNFRRNVKPDPKSSCGPYKPDLLTGKIRKQHSEVKKGNHDTIGMIVIDQQGHMYSGTSTNGLNHKVPGRVGDSPVMGAGSYASFPFGAAAATGDGDIMMRFLPSYRAVVELEKGSTPEKAAELAMAPIVKHYPGFQGALIAANQTGHHGAVCFGFSWFKYSVASQQFPHVQLFNVTCR